jgi:hypothetical protein
MKLSPESRCCGTTPVASTGTDPDGREWAELKCFACGAFVSRVKTGARWDVELSKEWSTMIREQRESTKDAHTSAAARDEEPAQLVHGWHCNKCGSGADTTWAQYKAAHAPYDAPPGFLRWLRVASHDGKHTHSGLGTREGVAAMLAAWQAGAAAGRDTDHWSGGGVRWML